MKKSLILIAVSILVVVLGISFAGCSNKLVIQDLEITGENLMNGATIVSESLIDKEKPDAENMLSDNSKCWTPLNKNLYANVEFKLNGKKTFNTAVIDEVGSEIRYFRLQAKFGGEWQTIYASEKMEKQRIISFDSVETENLRLSIEKFNMKDKYAKVKSIKLYNLNSDKGDTFNTTVYQRIDTEKPSEVLAKGEQYAKTFARYYDVYNTVIVFDVVTWDEQGNLIFKNEGKDGLTGKQYFERELDAIKKLVAMKTNPHKVRIIVTALADGAGGSHGGVNTIMHASHTNIANKMVETFISGYGLDGLDIDWEYPQNKDDWACYDIFMKELHDKMNAVKPDAIISAALSAWALGMNQETMDIIDQIQYMAYDDFNSEGIQSTIYNAQLGIARFVKNGATKSKINIGIPSYGRPINHASYWPAWNEVDRPNMYFDSIFERVDCGKQTYYDSAYCSPALAGDKTALAIFSGCGGVMVFRLTCDKLMDEKGIAVANGIENTLQRYFPTWWKGNK